MNPKITLAMLMCGIGVAAATGVAGAATPNPDVPSIAVKYDPTALETDSGARLLYARIATAATEVCPNSTSSIFLNPAVQECRQRAIENAVAKTHNPRLAAVYLSASKHG
jgi:UrcA family protein